MCSAGTTAPMVLRIATSTAGGGNARGSNGQLQYNTICLRRHDRTFFNNSLGRSGLVLHSQWALQIASSTAPQLALSDGSLTAITGPQERRRALCISPPQSFNLRYLVDVGVDDKYNGFWVSAPLPYAKLSISGLQVKTLMPITQAPPQPLPAD